TIAALLVTTRPLRITLTTVGALGVTVAIAVTAVRAIAMIATTTIPTTTAAVFTLRPLAAAGLGQWCGFRHLDRAIAEQRALEPPEQPQVWLGCRRWGRRRLRRRRRGIHGNDGCHNGHRRWWALGLQCGDVGRVGGARHLVGGLRVFRCADFIPAHAADLVLRGLDIR